MESLIIMLLYGVTQEPNKSASNLNRNMEVSRQRQDFQYQLILVYLRFFG